MNSKENSKELLLALQKKYLGHQIKLLHIEEERETLEVDGEQIQMAWSPCVDTIVDKTVVPVLVEDVSRAIDLQIENAKDD